MSLLTYCNSLGQKDIWLGKIETEQPKSLGMVLYTPKLSNIVSLRIQGVMSHSSSDHTFSDLK